MHTGIKVAAAAYLAISLCQASPPDFHQRLSRDEEIPHALSRLTFGARPGDVQYVQSVGLKKWIGQQLHPDRIRENPILAAKLGPLDSLSMSPAQMIVSYPSPGTVKDMFEGKIPLPGDPDKRLMVDRLLERYERQRDHKRNAEAGAPELATLLAPEPLRLIRSGTPQQKYDVFRALAPERQDEVLEAMPQGLRVQLFAAAPPALRRQIQLAGGGPQVVFQDLAASKLLRAVYSNRQLEEVLTDFWFNHFNVFLDKGADHYLVTAYERDVIRPHVFGKFEDMLIATAQSPAMLFYLDNWDSVGPNSQAGKNRKRGLNENYGRELLELHTLGVNGGYTQKDVTEVARCFTGWTIHQPQHIAAFEFNENMHDEGPKVVLGKQIPEGGGIRDGFTVLRMLAHHPSTARFISRKLAERFVSDDPPQPLIDRMAATFLKKDGDLRAVLKSMFESPEFWSRGAYRAKIKSPLEMVASSVRALNADVDFTFGLDYQLAQLGEPLYRKIEPTGYSNSSQEWLNSAGLLARMNFGMALANNRINGVKVDTAEASEGVKLGSPEFQKR